MTHKPLSFELDRELSELWSGIGENTRRALHQLGESEVPRGLEVELCSIPETRSASAWQLLARPLPAAVTAALVIAIALFIPREGSRQPIEMSDEEMQEAVMALDDYDLSRSLAFNVFDQDLSLLEGML